MFRSSFFNWGTIESDEGYKVMLFERFRLKYEDAAGHSAIVEYESIPKTLTIYGDTFSFSERREGGHARSEQTEGDSGPNCSSIGVERICGDNREFRSVSLRPTAVERPEIYQR